MGTTTPLPSRCGPKAPLGLIYRARCNPTLASLSTADSTLSRKGEARPSPNSSGIFNCGILHSPVALEPAAARGSDFLPLADPPPIFGGIMKKATLILFALALIAFVPLALAGDTQSGNGTRRIHKATVNYVYSANR